MADECCGVLIERESQCPPTWGEKNSRLFLIETIQASSHPLSSKHFAFIWMPACAGMTVEYSEEGMIAKVFFSNDSVNVPSTLGGRD